MRTFAEGGGAVLFCKELRPKSESQLFDPLFFLHEIQKWALGEQEEAHESEEKLKRKKSANQKTFLFGKRAPANLGVRVKVVH